MVRAASFSDKLTGEFLVSLPSGSSYALNVSNQGYLFYSGNYTLGNSLTARDEYQVDIQLSPIEVGGTIILNNIFFESGSSSILNQSKPELNKVVELLNANSKMRIEVGGHTDNIGNDLSNVTLSEQRAKSVMNYLIEKGIAATRIEAKGFGKSKPVADNSTELGRSKNRRTEFKVLSN